MLTLVKIKRINDLTSHSIRISSQIAGLPPLRTYLLEQNDAPSQPEAEKLLRLLIDGDPFIEELVLIDQFGKIPFSIQITQEGLSVDSETTSPSFPLEQYLPQHKPSLNEEDWEYRIPLSLESGVTWGMVKMRWRSDATWKYFRLLRLGIAYLTVTGFSVSFLLGFILIRRTYDREFGRLAQNLSLICRSDYTQRIDTQSFSKGIAEIGVHVNRILHDTEEEKKKAEVLDQTLRQIERGCSDYRRALNDRSGEMEAMRREMRESLIQLFDMLWCGILVLDENYRIHFINDQAERLLRFAKLEDSFLADDRLRSCLSPLIRQKSVDAIDDLCVWPQPSLGQSVSCHIRASRILVGGNERLYFLLLREEGGYPKKHNSAYFSEKLLLDYLVRDSGLEQSVMEGAVGCRTDAARQEDRFRACLRRLEIIHALEKGDLGPVTSIRLTTWLKNHFSDDDLFSEYLNLDVNVPDLEISLRTPERIFRELLDTMLILIGRLMEPRKLDPSQYLVLRASLDSNGKPMITLSLPGLTKREAMLIHELLNERVASTILDESKDGSLEDLEMDICYSLFRSVKQILRAHVVCVYSEIKKLAMVRMTIENHSFQSVRIEPPDPIQSDSSPKPDLVQQFLSRM